MPYEKSSPTSPEAQSASPVQDNLRALATLFPSVVRDGQVDVDALRQLCGEAVVKEDELFGLNWRGKAEARRAALTPSLGTLRPCREESKDWETTQNLYIEGDNLEVLKLLRKSYGGRVKMIFIDPPYNTGKDFVYPDNYQNGIENYKKLTRQEAKFTTNVETSGRFHTDWLNMMYPRLKVARDMLTEDGIVFISIDDHECANLATLCNEIFGESNFISVICWQKFHSVKANSEGNISSAHDYILVYAKDREHANLIKQMMDEKSLSVYKNLDNDPRGVWRTAPLTVSLLTGARGAAYKKTGQSSGLYPLYSPTGKEYWPSAGRCWISKDTIMELEKDGRIWWGKDGGCMPMKKLFLSETGGVKAISTFWGHQTYGSNKTANEELKRLFSDIPRDIVVFPTPKPTSLISNLIQICCERDNSVILDFFAGSSTTAHAVFIENAKKSSNYRFIMVQLPELVNNAYFSNICEIGKERIRRAGEKVKADAGLAGQKLDVGFRVYKLDSSNVKAWNPQAEDLATAVNNYAEHLIGGRTEEDFLTEIMLKSGIDLVEDVEEREIAGHRVQSLGFGQYYACMAADLAVDAEDVALGIAAWHEENCVFAGGEQQDTCTVFVSDRAFASNDAAKMNFVAILEQHGICNIKAL